MIIDFDYYIVCSDFNINILGRDSTSTTLFDYCSSAGLNIVNNSVPTRFSENTVPTLLDIFLVSDLSRVIKFDQTSFVSDQDLIFCCIDIPLSDCTMARHFNYRDFRNINIAALYNELSCVSWSDCWMFVSVDGKLNWLMSVISCLFDRYVPLKVSSAKSNSTPWFTLEVQKLIQNRNGLHSKWKRSPSELNWKNYKEATNRANYFIKRAKSSHFSALLDTSLSTKQLWQNIKKLRICSSNTTPCLLDPEPLNSYFIATTNPPSAIPTPVRSGCSVENPFEFSSVTESEVALHVTKIQSNAVGVDGIPIRFIKLILPYILSSLTHIINHCLTTSTFPNIWKIATVTPIAKKSGASEPNDFRPISILSGLSKLIERIISEQVTSYLDTNRLLSSLQSGFRPGHSCNTAMMKILDDIITPYDHNKVTLLCLLDFSKAFDTVSHKVLCDKLDHIFNFSKSSVKLIENYLCNRQQRVKINDTYSSFVSVLSGVPQGSSLGLLFSMYINDIFEVCRHVTMHAYADDVQLYLSGNRCDIYKIVNDLNIDLMAISKWATDNNLRINVTKSMVLPISYREISQDEMPPVVMDSGQLQVVSKVKNLEYIINSKLTCCSHINSVISKTYAVLRMLRVSSEFTPITIKKNLVLQLIMSYFNYFATVYSALDANCRSKISVAFNNVIRYVFFLRRFDHVSPHARSLLNFDIHEYLEIRNLLVVHDLIQSMTPLYLYDKFLFCQSIRTKQLVIPSFRHLCSSRLFFVNAVRLWNSLPVAIRSTAGRTAFRKALYKHYLPAQS